ncbi:MAG: hypothetical protein J6T70_10925 [Bacteroidales bacterium]|nr:hypothetical protein [Bacteroidales bacterium]
MEWQDYRLSEIFVLPGKAAYIRIPKETILKTLSDLCYKIGKDGEVFTRLDAYPHGNMHRWYGGHDLPDVIKTFWNEGFASGIKHIKHLFSDISTPKGLPKPFCSEPYLGKLLQEKCNFTPRQLCFNLTDIVNGFEKTLNVVDKGVGILCVGEGGMDVFNAFSGKMEMNFATFCDTFGEGAFQLAFGIPTGNGLAIAAGIENILAGIVSTWETYSISIDLVPFFGATLTSTLLGFITSKYLCKNEMPEVIQKSVKSGMITALFQLSASFGYGAAACCAYIDYVKYLAQRDTKQVAKVMKVDENYHDKFLQILNSFEDKKIRDAYLKFDNLIVDKIASSGGYERLIGKKRLDIAMSVLNKGKNSDMKKMPQGDFLVTYLESKW